MVDAERLNGSEVGRVIPNAPLRLPDRKRLFHTPPPWAKSGEIFFITLCCAPRGKNQLANASTFSVLRDALEHNQTEGKLWAHLLLAMPDHLHGLFAFPHTERMDAIVRNLKRYLAKAAGIRWQDGFFDHRLRSHESFEEKAHYIRMNPIRAGLAARPEAWPYAWPAHASEVAR